jgi:hypothetical protein
LVSLNVWKLYPRSSGDHARTKHIAIRYHFIRQEVDKDNVCFDYIETSKQAADGVTKPLGKIAFARFISQLNLM